MNNYIRSELRKQNCYINQIFYSPYHPNASIKKFKKKSSCRKPGIKFYKIIRKDWDIKYKNILMIGDKVTDLEFAKNCGIKGLIFNQNNLYNFIKNKI